MKEKKTKLAIIGTVGLPAKYGGFETLAEQLVNHLGHKYEMTVYCAGKQYPKAERMQKFKQANLHYLPLKANGVQSIPYDTLSILHACKTADVLLVLGVSGAWILPLIRLFTKKKIIISIDGIEWKRAKWNILAKWYLYWSEKIAIKYSHIDISDNESIQDYTAFRYGSLSRVVEYGTDHVLEISPSEEDLTKYSFLRYPYAFKVCRIEPENNVHVVLEAFSQLEQYPLVIVGNWENSSYGQSLRAKYGSYENIHLLDPIYDQRGLDLLRSNALIYIHGHSAGGTNPSLVEAMRLGLPIIAFNVSYNRTTTEQKALYFNDVDSLKNQVKGIKYAQVKTLGTKLKEIALRRYSWEIIARKYDQMIIDCLSGFRKKKVRGSIQKMGNQQLIRHNIGHLANAQAFFKSI